MALGQPSFFIARRLQKAVRGIGARQFLHCEAAMSPAKDDQVTESFLDGWGSQRQPNCNQVVYSEHFFFFSLYYTAETVQGQVEPGQPSLMTFQVSEGIYGQPSLQWTKQRATKFPLKFLTVPAAEEAPLTLHSEALKDHQVSLWNPQQATKPL